MFQIKTLETRRKLGICALAGTAALAMVSVVSADDDTCTWGTGLAATPDCKVYEVSFLDAFDEPNIRAGTLIGATIFDVKGAPLAKVHDFVFDRDNRLQDVIVTNAGSNALTDRPNTVFAIDARDIRVIASPIARNSSGASTAATAAYVAERQSFTPFVYEWDIQSVPSHMDAIAVEEVTFSSLTSAYVINRDGSVLGSAEDLFIDPTGRINYVLLDALASSKQVAVAFRPLPATDTNDIILDIDRVDVEAAPDFDPQRALSDSV